MKFKTLNDNLHYVKKVLIAPYHFFTFSPKNTKLIILTIEDKSGKRYQFTGPSIWSTVEEAYLYIVNEIKAGTMKDIQEKTSKKESKKDETK
jgi:asparagine N-glycosylation enzyme membrane subunit Stt3